MIERHTILAVVAGSRAYGLAGPGSDHDRPAPPPPIRARRGGPRPSIMLRNEATVSGLCLAPADGGTGINVALVTCWCDADPSRSWLVVSF